MNWRRGQRKGQVKPIMQAKVAGAILEERRLAGAALLKARPSYPKSVRRASGVCLTKARKQAA